MGAEKNFENKVKDFLQREGCYFIKYWGGGDFTRAGVPDLLVCCKGTFVGVELKASNGKPKLLQIHHLKGIDQAGGYGILLYPQYYPLFINFIHCLKQGDLENTLYNYGVFKRIIRDWEKKLNG